MKWELYNKLKSLYSNVGMTFGYITKYNRINNGIEKSHTSDAFTIAKNFGAKRLGHYHKVKLARRHNRQIHKVKILKGGKKRNNQAPFEVNGFRLFDRVRYENKIMFVTSRRVSGWFAIRNIDYGDKHELSYKKLRLERVKRNMIRIKTE